MIDPIVVTEENAKEMSDELQNKIRFHRISTCPYCLSYHDQVKVMSKEEMLQKYADFIPW